MTVLIILALLVSDINECAPEPCKNGGKCVDGDNSYICNCVLPYRGDTCEEGKFLLLQDSHISLAYIICLYFSYKVVIFVGSYVSFYATFWFIGQQREISNR